jgi:serine/threonine-protein kinase RIM15
MAGNGTPSAQFLAPPAVTALRQEARGIDPKFPPMTRSLSENMREEREELKEAAEQTLNVIVDLDLDGRIKWVSPSWRQVVGSCPESIEGRMISDFLVDNKTAFHDAIESMKEDDSRSRFIRFSVRMGPESILKYSPEPRPVDTVTEESSEGSQPSKEVDNCHDVLSMEGQGIMVFERTPDGTGHVGFHPFRHNALTAE